ncbi:N-6 DNA methylase [Tepidimonas sp.]|uniref:N-6 DNA methylase n=1 Tax=Tepidimonas sp. TaxID=2002775 RepID=UPI002FE324A4
MTAGVHDWLEKLGYAAEPAVLHVRGETVPETHPYALEIRALLKPDGAIRAQAVFDVEGVPTVVFVGDDGGEVQPAILDQARKRIWNQNLATVVIEFKGDEAIALPVRRLRQAEERLKIQDARPDGPFSALDVATANLSRRLPKWFDVRARVDRRLLSNLSATVSTLTADGFTGRYSEKTARAHAELLMGQVLFISYLEHREIVGGTYRERRNVGQLSTLVAEKDREGIRALIDHLRHDFNGDFLGSDRHDPWLALSEEGFSRLNQFLRRTDMRTGQGEFWNYDFSYIPVELLSGLYETFLTPEEQAKAGAYYTPRNLAVLAVDQALAASPDPLSERIFDGACGSGILLTTAYRRLIALAEADLGRQLGFAERGKLLQRSIFGGDINLMACRVTAFSLYLSLLEGLAPADILEAQDREDARLPSLSGENLVHGEEDADFFRPSHTFAGQRFSLIISNPPWTEPEGQALTSADAWADRAEAPFARRQIAGAYALRALEFLADGGRVCLILPIGQLLGPSSASFVAHLLRAYQPELLINFGDLQALLFPTAENTCHVFVAAQRQALPVGHIPFGETFEYLVPKADLSLALGRLTMQSADRHFLQTRAVAEDPQLLVTMMWGDANDLAIWTRLGLRGTFADFWRGPPANRRWVHRKGIHLEDKSRQAVDAGDLRTMPHIRPEALTVGSPVLHEDLLVSWPVMKRTVVGLNDAVRAVFDGPRVLFPDGFSREEQNIRAVYYDGPATFTHSIGVISGPQLDAPLLQFAAVYLRSTLARYFLMMRGWKMLCERNGIHLKDVEAFPFFGPEAAPKPDHAQAALTTIVGLMAELRDLPELKQRSRYLDLQDTIDEAIFSYFGLSEEERVLIRETVDILMPSVRPRSFKSLDTPAQHRARQEDIDSYASALGAALTDWRRRMAGRGRFTVDIVAGDPERSGPSGVVKVSFVDGVAAGPLVRSAINDEAVLATLALLRNAGMRVIGSGDFLALVPDVHCWIDGSLYLARPLIRRSWTVRQARRDAEQIVRTVQANASSQQMAGTA